MKRSFLVLMFVLGLSFLGLPYLSVRHSDSGSALAAPPEQEESTAARDADDDDDHERDTDDSKDHKHKHKPQHIDSLGPVHFAGRVRALVVRPDDTNTIWAATASGGLWVTHDAGSTWSHASDVMRTLAFSSITIDPSNPNVMYAGSGEIHTSLHLLDTKNPDGTPVISEVGSDAGLNLRSPRRGFGIFKTTDGGAHWTELTSTTLNKDFFYVNRIAVHPQNSNIVLAATATGLWRSSNGGATWALSVHEVVIGGFVVRRDPLTGIFLDVKFHSQDPSNVVATTFDGQVWFSTDGASIFNSATLPSSIPTGVPANASTRIELAFLRSQPGVWFAAEFFNKNSGEDPIILLRSTNNGATFSPWSNPNVIPCGNNRLYSGALFVSEFGTDVFVGGTELCHSGDGGTTFTQAAESGSMHNDYHSIVQGGTDGFPFFNGTIIVGNDGGIFRILDPTRLSGVPFDSPVVNLNNGLVNQQFHGAAINSSGVIVGGLQDIGSLHRATDGTWTELIGGAGGSDGTTTAADPAEPNLFYFGKSGARLYATTANGGKQCIARVSSSPLFDMNFDGASCSPTTSLTAPVMAGATSLSVASATFIDPGTRMSILDGPTSTEGVMVASTYDGTSLTVPLVSALRFKHATGVTVNFALSRCLGATPILLDPNDPNTLYAACERLWRTGDVKSSVSWRVIKDATSVPGDEILISAIARAPWDSNVMWVGTLHFGSSVLPKAGELSMTTQLQASRTTLRASWQKITDPMILPNRPVSGVALHPTDKSRVYVSYSGWTSNDVTNTSNNLFRGIKGADGKFHFTDISIGLPGGPVYSVALSPAGRIAAGTEFGARISDDDGATWRLVGPRVPIAGFTWIDANHLLIATYGRGLQEATF